MRFKKTHQTFLNPDFAISSLVGDKAPFEDLKIVVLQNEYSASGSEILSVFLKEYAGATVIGKKSYGKGTVQSLIPLSDGGALKLTVAEYLVGPKLIKVNGIGVTPTIEVENPKPGAEEKDDAQLQKAIEILGGSPPKQSP